MIEHLRFTVAALIALTLLPGCATERHILPTLSASPRTGLELNRPMLGAVFDGRTAQEPKDAASQLQTDLRRLYGPAIEWVDYFTKRWLIIAKLQDYCLSTGHPEAP